MTIIYLVSICFLTNHHEIVTEPFGPFNGYEDAEEFANKKIDEIKNNFKIEYDCEYEDIEELFEFDFTIKEITDKEESEEESE